MAEDGPGTGAAEAGLLPDRIALGVLTRLVTRELVEDVLAETGRKEQRKRLLPARVVVYFVLALALFYGDSYEEVMRKLAQGLSWLAIWKHEWHVPTSSALAQARERLGIEPLRELFERAAVPCAQLSTAGAWLCGRRVMSIDGVELDVADTPANGEYFGHRRGKTGTAAFPRVLVMALAECGTHAVTAAVTGTAGTGEVPLARALAAAPRNLEPGMLVLAGRGLYSYKMITAVAAAGADFCVRVKAEIDLPVLEWLPDGSYRSYIAEPKNKTQKLAYRARTLTDLPGIYVRVVDYDIPGRGGEVVTLVTSILDHQDTPAPELAAAYHQRWEIDHVDQMTAKWREPTRQRVRHRTPTPLHAGRRKTAADSVLPAAVPVDHAAHTERPDLAQAPVVRRGQADPTRAG